MADGLGTMEVSEEERAGARIFDAASYASVRAVFSPQLPSVDELPQMLAELDAAGAAAT